MPSSGYVADTFIAGEQPTTSKWNELWGNDASFNSGAGFNDSILVSRHFATSGLQLPDKTLNPYKFSAYRNAAQNTSASAFVVLQCDTKIYDTGSNLDIVTNKGRFTAPIAGFYNFTAAWQGVFNGTGAGGMSLFKNGVRILDGSYTSSTAFVNTFGSGWSVTGTLQLAAGDYVEAEAFCSATLAISVGSNYINSFQGFLVSAT